MTKRSQPAEGSGRPGRGAVRLQRANHVAVGQSTPGNGVFMDTVDLLVDITEPIGTIGAGDFTT